MPAQTISDEQLTQELLGLFRASGFDGVSLTDLQEATGLKRSSLYHRFPGGKLEMAVSVLDAVAGQLREHVLSLAESDAPLDDRIRAIGREISAFYDGGRLACLLDSMTVGVPADDIAARTKATAVALIETFTGLAVEAGQGQADAEMAAVDVLAALEGALVVSRLIGERSAFERVIASLPRRLGTS